MYTETALSSRTTPRRGRIEARRAGGTVWSRVRGTVQSVADTTDPALASYLIWQRWSAQTGQVRHDWSRSALLPRQSLNNGRLHCCTVIVAYHGYRWAKMVYVD